MQECQTEEFQTIVHKEYLFLKNSGFKPLPKIDSGVYRFEYSPELRQKLYKFYEKK